MNSKLSKMVRQLISVVLLVTFTFASQGCNKLSREYGISEGAEARQSPAAISIFRNLCDSEGCDTKEVRSLSPRAMDRLKAIVWSPNHFGAHRSETFEWMNQWLASGDRTLVYVGRDFSAMEDYWRQCSEKLLQAENNQEERWNCLEQIAIAQRELDQLRSSVRQNVATPWFLFDYTNSVEKQVKSVSGPWADSIDMSKSRIFLRGVPVGMNHRSYSDLKKIFDREPAPISAPATTNTGAPATAPNTIAPPANSPAAPEFELEWSKQDADMLTAIKMFPESDLPRLDFLLATKDREPLIAEITSSKWGKSRVIVLANSSMISNLGLINDQNRTLARRLIAKLPKKSVGFVSGSLDPIVRKDDLGEQQKGFEMLTIWPINVVTLHAVFLGMLALIALFPIFGRPKLLPRKSHRDFGLHVDAVGAMLLKSKDRFYALATIADYFRQVRKEPTSPWANVDPVAQQDPTSPFAK